MEHQPKKTNPMTAAENDERRRALSAQLSVDDFHPLSSTVRVEVGARSHEGMVRNSNDDHYLVVGLDRQQETLATSLPESDLPRPFNEHGFAMAVADGIGSGGAASVASRVALSTIAHLALQYGRWNLRIDPKIAAEVVARAAWLHSQADEAVVARRQSDPALADMTTTLTAVYSAGDHLFVSHVGHSRVYLFRDGRLTQLTQDHTAARHLAETGKPVAMERRGQDLNHILTDAIGSRGGKPAVEVEHIRLLNGDCILLCTNGLTDMVDDERIADTLAIRRHSEEQCRILVDLANQQGGQDNVTVIVAQYEIPKEAEPSR